MEKNIELKKCLLENTSAIVSAYLRSEHLTTKKIPDLIEEVYGALLKVSSSQSEENLNPAIDIKNSIHKDYIICLEDGKQLKMLKRYLKTKFNMTPEDYRKKWNLPNDYPFVAPSYAKQRSKLAKSSGLGK